MELRVVDHFPNQCADSIAASRLGVYDTDLWFEETQLFGLVDKSNTVVAALPIIPWYTTEDNQCFEYQHELLYEADPRWFSKTPQDWLMLVDALQAHFGTNLYFPFRKLDQPWQFDNFPLSRFYAQSVLHVTSLEEFLCKIKTKHPRLGKNLRNYLNKNEVTYALSIKWNSAYDTLFAKWMEQKGDNVAGGKRLDVLLKLLRFWFDNHTARFYDLLYRGKIVGFDIILDCGDYYSSCLTPYDLDKKDLNLGWISILLGMNRWHRHGGLSVLEPKMDRVFIGPRNDYEYKVKIEDEIRWCYETGKKSWADPSKGGRFFVDDQGLSHYVRSKDNQEYLEDDDKLGEWYRTENNERIYDAGITGR